MSDERRSGLSVERIEHILKEAGLEQPIDAKKSFYSRVDDILAAIGVEGSDEFGLAFVSAAKPELSPGELAARLKKIESEAGRLWKTLSDPPRSLDGGGTGNEERTTNTGLADALVLESRVDHIRETGKPAPILDASLDIRHVINRIGELEKIAAEAAIRARKAVRKGQPRKTLLDSALELFANLYCEFFEPQTVSFDLPASEKSPFIRLTLVALGRRECQSEAALVKRWEALRASHREALST